MNRILIAIAITACFCTTALAQEKPPISAGAQKVIDAKTIPDVTNAPWVSKDTGPGTLVQGVQLSGFWQFQNSSKLPAALYENPVDKIQLAVYACPKPEGGADDCLLWFGDDDVQRWAIRIDEKDGKSGKWVLAKEPYTNGHPYSGPQLSEIIYRELPGQPRVMRVKIALETEQGFAERVLLATSAAATPASIPSKVPRKMFIRMRPVDVYVIVAVGIILGLLGLYFKLDTPRHGIRGDHHE